jgi:hypothetical protein
VGNYVATPFEINHLGVLVLMGVLRVDSVNRS